MTTGESGEIKMLLKPKAIQTRFEILSLELDSVSVLGFTPQPSHWFIQPEPAWLSSLPRIIVKRTITALCVPATASADSPEDLNQSAI
ncbi:hypothetical protein ILYODFUR_039031 [Ilyodon furcidens]|uniref:Uncharacterized protein n=1 Tax=Ilyodon furcidens TaxID=33524 RepID=A0ABV0UC08_9TELE